jgi:hypothetical protein
LPVLVSFLLASIIAMLAVDSCELARMSALSFLSSELFSAAVFFVCAEGLPVTLSNAEDMADATDSMATDATFNASDRQSRMTNAARQRNRTP